MLRSEITELQESVAELLQKYTTGKGSGFVNDLAGQTSAIAKLCAALKNKWTHELLTSAKDTVIKRYVQFHEAGLVELSDQITAAILPAEAAGANHAVRAELYRLLAKLENVLDFLRHQFYPYFDVDHKATFYHCQVLKQQFETVRPVFDEFVATAREPSLVNVMITSVDEVLEESMFTGISYRQATQVLNLAHMTHDLILAGKANTPLLLRAFYQQNLNSFHFFHWYQVYISGLLAPMKDPKEKEALIGQQLAALVGNYVSRDKALQPELPPTDVFLMKWLREQTGTTDGTSTVTAETEQLPLNLSVPQFALFVRLLYKTGCFPVENVALITRFFTAHFTTKKQPHISRKSFARAFYNLDQPAAAVVRDSLQKMLNYLNKTYFP